MIDNEQFENITGLDTYSLLQEMSVEVLEESLRRQIPDPLSTRVNFLSNIEDIYNFYEKQHDDSIRDDILEVVDRLINETSRLISETYNFSLDIETLDSRADRVNGVVDMYRFLILRYKKNISNYIFNYIIKNRKSLAEEFASVAKKKDVTIINTKKKIRNKEGIIIISNLTAVIKYILSLHCEVDTFIELSASNYYESEQVRNLWEQGYIQGSFVRKYFDLMIDEYDDVIVEVFEDVKMKIIERLNVKK